MREKDLPPEEFKWVDWAPFRKAFPILFGAPHIISLDAGEGWRPLVWDLCAALEAHAKVQMANGGEPVVVVQVKQKFGGLRFYVDHGDEITRSFVDAAEAIAETTCEACGAPAKTRSIDGWFSTFCPRHVEVALEWGIRRLNQDP